MKNVFFILLSVFVSLPMFCSCAENETDYTKELLQAGTTAPNFSIAAPDGVTLVKLSDHLGKYVVLDFWASWCPDCQKDMPNMVNIYKEFKDKDVVFIGISFDTDKSAWTAAIAKYGIEYYQASELKKWKNGTTIDGLYHVNWIPTMYLIDTQGKIVYSTINSSEFKAKMEEIFK